MAAGPRTDGRRRRHAIAEAIVAEAAAVIRPRRWLDRAVRDHPAVRTLAALDPSRPPIPRVVPDGVAAATWCLLAALVAIRAAAAVQPGGTL